MSMGRVATEGRSGCLGWEGASSRQARQESTVVRMSADILGQKKWLEASIFIFA